jgi:predicted dehydrogenase
MKVYRVAIIGLGRMGSTIDEEVIDYPAVALPYSIAACCAHSNRLELVAGADLLAEKRDAFGAKWGTKALYDDFVKMIEQEKPDLVAVCTKGENHAELGAAVAELGVPMLYLEKAMGCSMAEADLVREACLKNETVFNTGVLRRFDVRYRVVREAIDRGDVGEPIAAVHYAATNLLHGHIHSIDTLSYLLGDPAITRVQGELRSGEIVNNRIDKDPNAIYRLAFEKGVEAWTVPAGHWEFEVLGTEGTIRSFNNGVSQSLRRLGAPVGEKKRRMLESVVLPDVTPKSAVLDCLEDLLDAYENDRPTLGHVGVTHHITEACLAVAQSHRDGGVWVDVPGVDRELYVYHV